MKQKHTKVGWGLLPKMGPVGAGGALLLLYTKSFPRVVCQMVTVNSTSPLLLSILCNRKNPNPALHLVLSGLEPCFYPAAALTSPVTVKSSYIYTVLKLHSAL